MIAGMLTAVPESETSTLREPQSTQHILSSLRRILRTVEVASVALEREHGVTQPQLVCLRALQQHGPMTQVELSREIHVGASTLVGVVDRLESKGLVKRVRVIEDRRKLVISLTPAGILKTESAPEPLHQQVQRGLSNLPASELDEMSITLARLAGLIDIHAERTGSPALLASGPIPKPPEQEGQGS